MAAPKRLQRHRGWLAGSLATAGLALALALAAPRAGSRLGLLLGVVGAALVAVCALRGLRRRRIRMPLGSAATWLKAHVWLGLLSLVFSLAHGGFRLGGPLSTALTLLLITAVLSGVLGVVLKRVLTREINALSALVERHTGGEDAPLLPGDPLADVGQNDWDEKAAHGR